MTLLLEPPTSVAFVREPVQGPDPRTHARWTVAVVTGVALALNVWALSRNGMGNDYYTAAARSMAGSWRNWFFASFDGGGFISVDKPPLPLWITALSVRVFGASSWSVLLPSALAGTAAVPMLWLTVRRWFGTAAATIAALVLAISPVNVAVNRLNLPEPWLILLLVCAVWALQHALDRTGRAALWWTAASAGFIGLGFNTKMLAAYLVVPALGLGIVLGRRVWRERIRHSMRFLAVMVATSLPWVLIVDLWPASSRPYVGGSTNNTVWDLIFGYNGLGRVEGSGQGAASGAMSAAGGIFGGAPGALRLLSDSLGGQIAWLLPLALAGAIAAGWMHRRDHLRRAAVAMWVAWVVVVGWIFSNAQGTFHAYYTSLMTPAVAALVGIGCVAMVRAVRSDPRWLAAPVAGLAATVALQRQLIDRAPGFYDWIVWPMTVVLLAAIGVVVWAAWRRRGRALIVAGGIALAGCLLAPAAWALSETNNTVLNSTLPQAGPRQGAAGTSFGSASWNGDPELVAWLRANDSGETWLLVTSNAQQASGLIADEGVDVLAIGGFMGTDDSTTVAEMSARIAAGEVRWFLVSGNGFGGGRGGRGFGGGSSASSSIMSAVQSSCTVVTDASLPSAYQGAIYDCAGATLTA